MSIAPLNLKTINYSKFSEAVHPQLMDSAILSRMARRYFIGTGMPVHGSRVL
jgi:hypothetical protein